MRSLQEEFDARLYPYGWTNPDFKLTADWLAAMPLNCPPDEPAICSTYTEYMLDLQGEHGVAKLRARSVPAMRDYMVPVLRLAESCSIAWTRPVEEYFDFRAPDAFHADREPSARELSPGVWEAELAAERGAALTFELAEQIVGWPYFTIDAPAGTVIELMVQEAHELGGCRMSE